MRHAHIVKSQFKLAAQRIGERAGRVFSGTLCLTAVILLSVAAARADWLNTTGAETVPNFVEFDILDDRVVVALEIDFPDYPSFVPEEVKPVPPDTEPDASDLSPMTGTTFEVEADGSSIAPQVRSIEVRDRKPRPTAAPSVAVPPKRGARVIAVELEFPFSGKPKILTFRPPRDDKGNAAVNLGFLAHHKSVPVTDYRYLSQAERLTLDWDDPWYSTFQNPNLTRHHRAALMSFVSIEPRECRHEIIFRLRDLEEWTDLDFGESSVIDAAQRSHITRTAEQFFRGLDPLVEDGETQRPSAVRVAFLEVGAAGVQVVDEAETVNRVTALLGVVLSYPHRTLPQDLGVNWQLFTDRAQVVPVSVADPAGPVPGRVTPDAPEIAWTNFLKTWKDPIVVPVRAETGYALGFPVLSILLFAVAAAFVVEASRAARPAWLAVLAVLAGAAGLVAIQGPALTVKLPGGPDEKAVTMITEAIVRNTAVAMLETERESFDRALEGFVVHNDMEPVGAEMRRGLSVQLPSGARALTDKIENVNVEEVTFNEGPVKVLASWTAHVSGGHWGHRHVSRIDYRALIDFAEIDGVWRLCGLTVLSAQPTPSVQPNDPAAQKGPAAQNI